MKHLIVLFALLACLSGAALAQDAAAPQTPAEICAAAQPIADPAVREWEAAPAKVLIPATDYRAVFCTDAGPIYIDLLETYAPLTVNNFVFLAQQGYYNNTTFHRVIQDFMAQGGDPTASGMGGPGYQFEDEFLAYMTFDIPGLLAMANAGESTNGSQFFITTVPTPHLNYQHTIFGQVLEGQENATSLRLRDPQTDSNPGAALQTVVIIEDPALVTSTYSAPEPVTLPEAAVVDAALAQIGVELPDGLIIEASLSGVRTTDETVASAPEAARADLGTFLTEFGHQYRVSNAIQTTTCDLSTVPFMSISYTVDAFDTAENAGAALQAGGYDALALASGYTAAESPWLNNTYYTRSETVCDLESTHALAVLQRGRFITTAEIIVPTADLANTLPADQWLARFVVAQVYDSLLVDVFRAEIPW